MDNPNANIEKIKRQLDLENEKENIMVKTEYTEEVYVVCSAYDWLPVRMKTRRALELEKVPMNDPAPNHIMTVDN